MQPGVTGDGRPMAQFRFPADFVGFQGHFPSRSILPGACQIQCLLTLLEYIGGKPVALKEIVLAKYMAPVLPEESIICALSESPDFGGEGAVVKAFIIRRGERVSELRVRVTAAEAAEA